MLKVVKDRHSLTAQPQNAGIADLGFLRSQNIAVSTKRGDRSGQRVEVEDDGDNSL